MRSFRRRPSRSALPTLSALAVAVLLGACAMPANNGFHSTRTDATPFPQANERCWSQAYGGPQGGGSSQFGSAMSAYDRCMGQQGWERSKTMF